VTANGTAVSGASVSLAVTAPNGSVLQTSGTTGANGQVVFKYNIRPNAPTGTYMATAIASLSAYATGTGSTTFQVT